MHSQATQASHTLGGAVRVDNGHVVVEREQDLASPAMDALVREAVFSQGQARDHARWLIWEIGQEVGVRAASINDLYLARGRGEARGGWTVPAMNVRGMTYDTARSIFRTAIALDAGAFILEIARSEIAYTEQRPSEYVAVMLAAALREASSNRERLAAMGLRSREIILRDYAPAVVAQKHLSLYGSLVSGD